MNVGLALLDDHKVGATDGPHHGRRYTSEITPRAWVTSGVRCAVAAAYGMYGTEAAGQLVGAMASPIGPPGRAIPTSNHEKRDLPIRRRLL